MALMSAQAAWPGWCSIERKTMGACSVPATTLATRWVVRMMRTGVLTRVVGARDWLVREAISAQVQNKVSSQSDEDIVEGREQIG